MLFTPYQRTMCKREKYLRNRIITAFTLFLSLLQCQNVIADAGIEPNNSALRGYPSGLIQYTDLSPYLFWVALRDGVMHVLQKQSDGSYLSVEQTGISIGKQGFGKEIEGDQRTPVGVYRITSHIEDDTLDDFYGGGAFPLNYPNTWDKRKQRTGYGIWLHGLPKGVATRPLLDSNGCVVISNEKLAEYDRYISVGSSTVVLSETLDWLDANEQQRDTDLEQALNAWKSDWESRDADQYLSHYHPNFSDSKRDLKAWSKYKTRVNQSKSFIEVNLSQTLVISYPGEANLAMTRFFQDYKSSNHKWRGWKQLLWRRDATGAWKIIYEGSG